MPNVREIFSGKVVEKRRTRIQDLQEFPRYVVEYLVDNYCNEETFEQDLVQVKKKLLDNYATPSEAEKLKYHIRQKGNHSLIARIEVRLDPSEDKYWASISSIGERYIHISDRLLERYPRLLGGMWGIAEIGYDPNEVFGGKIRPFRLLDFTPFQVVRISLNELIEKRNHFLRNEWIDFLVSTVGLNPEAYTLKQKLIIVLRLVPLAERFVNLIELGPRETGKSYMYKNMSYYVTMLSGGRATRASLFVHLGTGKPGVIANFDAVVFDEIAHTDFTDPQTTVSIFKDYMEYGSFAVGKHSVKGETSVVMTGNIDVMGNLPHEKYSHLLEPLPEILQDVAFLDRVHGYLPGWEMPKLSPGSFATGPGLVMDYFAEILHALRNHDVIGRVSHKFNLLNAGSRDEKAVMKILGGLLKLVHPDGNVSEEELVDYLRVATELRQRVKDQLHVMAPGEFGGETLSFMVGGVEYEPELRERTRELRIRMPASPAVGTVVNLVVTDKDMGALSVCETLATKGSGALIPLGSMGKVMREALKTAYEYVSHNRRKFDISAEFKEGYDLSVLALHAGVPKEGPSAGLGFVIGIVSALTKRPVRNDVAVTGEITLRGKVEPVGNIGPKISAAKTAQARTVILPLGNRREAELLPEELRRDMDFIFVSGAEEALQVALLPRSG